MWNACQGIFQNTTGLHEFLNWSIIYCGPHPAQPEYQPCASLHLKDQYFACLKWERVSLSGTNFCLEGDGDLKRNPTLHEYVYWEGVTQLRIFLSPLYLYNQLDSFLKKHFYFRTIEFLQYISSIHGSTWERWKAFATPIIVMGRRQCLFFSSTTLKVNIVSAPVP